MPYETTDALVERGLIKDLLNPAFAEENETPMEEVAVSDQTEDAQEFLEEEFSELEGQDSENSFEAKNANVVFGVECVFKSDQKGESDKDALKIPVSKEKFEAFNEKKQLKIFKRAQKKLAKELKKKNKILERERKKREK